MLRVTDFSHVFVGLNAVTLRQRGTWQRSPMFSVRQNYERPTRIRPQVRSGPVRSGQVRTLMDFHYLSGGARKSRFETDRKAGGRVWVARRPELPFVINRLTSTTAQPEIPENRVL